MNRKALFKLIRPEGASLVFAGFALIFFLVGLLISMLALLDAPDGKMASMGLQVLFFIPLTSILLLISAFTSRRVGPRLALSLLIFLLVLTGAILLVVPTSGESPQISLAALCLIMAILCLPVFLVALIPSLIALPKLPAEIDVAIFEERCERAFDFLRRQDDIVTYRDLAHHLKTSELEVQRVLVALLERGQIKGTPYPQYGLYLEPWVVQRKLGELKALVALRGQISFAELAGEFRVPREIVEDWLAVAVAEGKFPGYVHWEEKTLYSEEAEMLRDFGRCPQCGGELRLAGKGVIHCTYCGYDIFLEKPASNKNAKKRSTPKPPKDDTTPQT